MDNSVTSSMRNFSQRADSQVSPMQEHSSNNATPMSTMDLLNSVQKIVLYLIFFLAPSFFIPAPWGMTEFSRMLLVIGGTIILLAIELTKIFNGERLSLAKGLLDLVSLGVLGSVAISTVTSQDITTSLWGFDYRLGLGLVSIIAIYIVSFVVKTVVKDIKDVAAVLRSVTWGIGLSALLSLISVMGTNIVGVIFGIEHLYTAGYPVSGLPVISIVIWLLGILMTLATLGLGTEKKFSFVHMISLVASIAAIALFGSVQGLAVLIVFAIIFVVLLVTMIMRRDGDSKALMPWVASVLAILVVAVGVMRIPAVQETVFKNISLSQQISLDGQSTWGIVVATLAESVSTGFLGKGVDTFAIYYNQYRPSLTDTLDLSTITYTYGSSEFMTIIGNRGLLGGMIWLAVGGLIGFLAYKAWSKNEGPESALAVRIMDLTLIALYLVSFVSFYSTFVYLMLFVLIAIRVASVAVIAPREAENIVLQLDMLVEQITAKKTNSVSVVLTIIVLTIGVLGMVAVWNGTSALANSLRAEREIIDAQLEIADGVEYTQEEQREIISNAVGYYGVAMGQMENNTYLYRRASALIMQYVDSQFTEVNEADDPQKAYEDVSDQIDSNVRSAMELTETAVETAPAIYANWDSRAFVYISLVQYGFTNYYEDALEALQTAAILNPSNPAIYYNVALMYNTQEEYSKALSATQQALNLRIDLEPLLLAGQLDVQLEEYEDSLTYFEAAKTVLEQLEAEEYDIYTAVVDKIAEIEKAIESGDYSGLNGTDETIDEELENTDLTTVEGAEDLLDDTEY